MKVTDEELRSAYQRATAGGAPEASGCLDDPVLERAASGRLQPEERERVADHLSGCSSCSEVVRMISELEDWARDAQTAVERTPGVVPFARRPMVRMAAVAAVLVVAVGLGALWRTAERSIPSVMRGMGKTGMAVSPVDGARLAEAPAQLSWMSEPGDSLHRVELFDAESTPLWTSEKLTGSTLDLPQSVRLRLAEPGRYYWRVSWQTGVVERTGPLIRFDVVAAPAAP
jgi:hypothetical protein